MLIKEECLQLIASQRTDEIVIATMGMSVPWAKISTHPLDYASVGSAMGHAADFALGIALAKPDKKVVVLNGDGSMLMCLGTLATITSLAKPPANYLLFVCDNGTYEVTGNQPVPRNADFSWVTIAKGTGFEQVYEFDDIDILETDLPKIWNEPGPVFVNLRIAQAHEPPPDRWGGFPYPYLQESLATSTHKLRKALEEQ
ncbi:MAG: thiamine pyrophosphate-dependent enzyme [Candidatus Poribacteria bacterium]|nr:thiamine pyrophosphate-dependent enzyme [Candidatus Poribacteria bacterium]